MDTTPEVSGRGPRFASGRQLTNVFVLIYLGFGAALGILAFIVPGYLHPGWRVAMGCIVGLDLLSMAQMWFRGAMTLIEEKIWSYVAAVSLIIAALCVADPVGSRLTTTLYVLSGLFGALCLNMVELVGLLVLVTAGTGLVMWHDADRGWLLVIHTAVVVVSSAGPAVMILLLRVHLADALERSIHQASTDPLTGLANRRGLREGAPGVLNRARRSGDSMGLLMVDIDHFKQVNDTYGHQVGDEVLRDVATAIRGCVRTEDVVVRVGGEEMAVLTSLPQAGLVALGERIRLAVARDCAVTVSIGVAWSAPGGADLDAVLEHLTAAADELLYEAKNGGRNQVRSPA